MKKSAKHRNQTIVSRSVTTLMRQGMYNYRAMKKKKKNLDILPGEIIYTHLPQYISVFMFLNCWKKKKKKQKKIP